MRYSSGQTSEISQRTERPTLRYQLLSIIIAIAYGGVLASLPLMAFSDRVNYLNYAANSWAILNHNWAQSPLVALANEPIWLLINSFLANFLSPEATLRVVIFVPASVVAWIVLQQNPRQFVWLVLFLLFPVVIRNHLCALRQGMAFSVFLIGWYSEKKPFRWVLIGLTPFIHSSFFFVLGLLGIAKVAVRLRLGPDVRTLLYILVGLLTGLGIGWVAAMLGARQALEYKFAMAEDASGLGFVFWALVLSIMCFQGRNYMRSYAFEMGAIVFYLTTYFFIEITARIFEGVILLVLLAGLQLTGWRRAAFLALIFMSAVLQYAMRLDQPWLGWGV